MRHAPHPSLVALLLVAPLLALSPAARADTVTRLPAPPSDAGRESRPVAIVLEALNPLGGLGCFYRRRYLPGILVAAGSLIGGSLALYAWHQSDRDGTIVGAVAYGAMRAIGLAAAAQAPSPPLLSSSFWAPSALSGGPETATGKTVGLSHRFSF